ncbi:MAG TPA: peptidylprolyl isomerase [Vitreimonas sp.]|nr:peptidylprolyl isomerase [Vitreimonas sp.]
MKPRFEVTHSRAGERPQPPPAPAAPAHGGCGHSRAGPEFPAVLVDGVEIDPERIAQETQNHPTGDPAEAWREAARALVVRELLLSEARRLGLESEPEEVSEGRFETDDESLIRAALERSVTPASPTDEECQRLFDGMKSRFVTPTLFEASHILIEPDSADEAGWVAAEAEARAIIELVGDDAKTFAAIARERSKCPTAQQDGSLGQIRRGELAPPVQAGLEALSEGETGKAPVRSRFGWHVLRLARRIEGRALPYDVVEPKIRDMLEARAWAVSAAQFVADLAAKVRIEGVELTPPDAGFSSCADGSGC